MKTVRCSFNNIHQNRKNLPRNKDDAYAHEVTERSAVPERSEVVWFSSNEVRFKGVRARPVGGAGAHAPEEHSVRTPQRWSSGAGAHAPEEVHLHERSKVVRSSIEQREVVWFFLLVWFYHVFLSRRLVVRFSHLFSRFPSSPLPPSKNFLML